MKKIAIASMVLLAGLVLTACGNGSSSGGKDTVSSSSKTEKTTAAKKSSSSAKKTSGEEVTNGSPVKVGQWKYYEDFDADGTLVRIINLNKTATQGKATITFKTIKIFSMKPKNDAAKKTASDYFDTSGVTDPYYVLQIIWSAKNDNSQEVQTNGLQSVLTSAGQQLEMGHGFMDQGTGAKLQAGASQDFEADGLLKDGEFKALNKLTVKIGSIADVSTYENISPETTIELPL